MIVRRIDDETLLNLIARFPSGRHPNIHAALHELAERREAARKKAVIWLAELDAAEGKAETKEGK